jgi:hypothetical protein
MQQGVVQGNVGTNTLPASPNTDLMTLKDGPLMTAAKKELVDVRAGVVTVDDESSHHIKNMHELVRVNGDSSNVNDVMSGVGFGDVRGNDAGRGDVKGYDTAAPSPRISVLQYLLLRRILELLTVRQ